MAGHARVTTRWYRRAAMMMVLVLAGPACGGSTEKPPTVAPAVLEQIVGSDAMRVTLTDDARRRLGVVTAPVTREEVVRTRQFGATLVSSFGGAASHARVVLTEGEAATVDRDAPSMILPLAQAATTVASPIGARLASAGPSAADDPPGTLYYALDDVVSAPPGSPVMIDLQLAGTMHLVVPYSAVVYDASGRTWVYTAIAPDAYVRHPIEVAYIEAGDAFLTDGPPAGTEVVVVGSGELDGFENGIGS